MTKRSRRFYTFQELQQNLYTANDLQAFACRRFMLFWFENSLIYELEEILVVLIISFDKCLTVANNIAVRE